MVLKIYNTLTRKIEKFESIEPNKVKMYTCGPTVYNYVHIGNLRAMLSYDLVRRYLKYKRYIVKHVMNITDVDDKTIRDSQKEKKTLKDFTLFYTDAFLKDLKLLNIEIPEIMPKATDEIEEMVILIKILLKKNIAYKTKNGDIYFSISKFKSYGQLAKIDLNKLKQNADGRLNSDDEYDKEDVRDFALWKSYDPKDGDVFWDTEIGKGRPGWHIECSAMSAKYLGQPFDIHMGGVDLIFPHHTNEIAQSESAYEKKFCNYWLHNEHLIVNGEKMSKSKGNFYTLKDLTKKGYDPISIRYELMSTHYRQKLDFREENLKKIPYTLRKFHNFLDTLDETINSNENTNSNENIEEIILKFKLKFEESMDLDLNISGALASIFEFMNEINKVTYNKKDALLITEFMNQVDSVLGIMKHKKETIPQNIKTLAEERWVAKQNKKWNLADEIRDKIKLKGFIIEDSKDSYSIKKKIN